MMDPQEDVESALPPVTLQSAGPVEHSRERIPDQHKWDLHCDQDSPGCPQMTSQEQSLKIHTHKGIGRIL